MRSVVLLALVIVAAGCTSGHRSTGPTAVVSESGRIGPLRMDQSARAAVVSFAGRPDAERRGRYPSFPSYRALGYDCSDKQADAGFPLVENGPYCQTVFFINRRTGRLGNFYTASTRYSESHGVRIGMGTAKAESLLRKPAHVGCGANVYLGPLKAGMTIGFTGGSPRKMRGSTALHLVGGHVYGFGLHGPRNELGVFDCM